VLVVEFGEFQDLVEVITGVEPFLCHEFLYEHLITRKASRKRVAELLVRRQMLTGVR